MKRILVIMFGMLPCLVFGQSQDVPSPEELDRSIDSSLAPGELVKKPEPKKIKKKVVKKKKAKKNLKKKKNYKINKNAGVKK